VYETIEEEKSNPPTPDRALSTKKSETQVACDEVFIVDPEAESLSSMWDDERGIVALRKYYALRDEAQNTVTESKLIWRDTPFSVFAVQCK
jgi:serine/arginine repetitive matrix protein 2